MKRKIIREVKLLSQMNHENVVRYFNAWIETQPGDAFSSTSILEEEDEDVGGSSSGRGPNSDGGSNGPGNSDSDSDSDSSGDSYISFTVSEVSEVNDTSDSVVVFENNSESTLSSPVEEGREIGEGEGGGGRGRRCSVCRPPTMQWTQRQYWPRSTEQRTSELGEGAWWSGEG